MFLALQDCRREGPLEEKYFSGEGRRRVRNRVADLADISIELEESRHQVDICEAEKASKSKHENQYSSSRVLGTRSRESKRALGIRSSYEGRTVDI